MAVETFDDLTGVDSGVATFATENLDIDSGTLIRIGNPDCQVSYEGAITDGIRSLKFHTAATLAGDFGDAVRLILKTTIHNLNLSVVFRVDTGQVYFSRMTDWGSFTEPIGSADDIGTVAADQDYWIVADCQGNDLTADVYDADPNGSPTPLASIAHTLSGGDATAWGSGVSGEVGIHPAPYRSGDPDVVWYDDLGVGELAGGAPPVPGELLWPHRPSGNALWP